MPLFGEEICMMRDEVKKLIIDRYGENSIIEDCLLKLRDVLSKKYPLADLVSQAPRVKGEQEPRDPYRINIYTELTNNPDLKRAGNDRIVHIHLRKTAPKLEFKISEIVGPTLSDSYIKSWPIKNPRVGFDSAIDVANKDEFSFCVNKLCDQLNKDIIAV
jgi:hypothetical protein